MIFIDYDIDIIVIIIVLLLQLIRHSTEERKSRILLNGKKGHAKTLLFVKIHFLFPAIPHHTIYYIRYVMNFSCGAVPEGLGQVADT